MLLIELIGGNAGGAAEDMSETERTYWDVIEPIWDRVNIYDSPDDFFTSIVGISRSVLIVYAAHFCLSEVRNGGFLQFFNNSAGVLGPEASDGFAAIQMPQLASIVREACDKLGDPYPRGRYERQTVLLDATGGSEEEIAGMRRTKRDSYVAYVRAMKPLGFHELEERVWPLADAESGGFEEAASRFCLDQGFFDR